MGVGYVIGRSESPALMFAGGVLSWLVLLPLLHRFWAPTFPRPVPADPPEFREQPGDRHAVQDSRDEPGAAVGHDRSASSFLVYLALWNATGGRRRAKARRSHRQLAEETGLSKSAVQTGIRRLHRRKLVAVSRASTTATPEYAILRPWQRG